MKTANAIVNTLLEDDEVKRYLDQVPTPSPLPSHVVPVVRDIRDRLQVTAEALRLLTRWSGLGERDDAVEDLSSCAEGLDRVLTVVLRELNTENWAEDAEIVQRVAALRGARDDLTELLNQDDVAKPQDAVIVQRVVAVLTDLLR